MMLLIHFNQLFCIFIIFLTTHTHLSASQDLQNFTEIDRPTDLLTAASKTKRQNGKPKGGGNKAKSNSYLTVYESPAQSYSTSYHHNDDSPATSFKNSYGPSGRSKDSYSSKDHDRDSSNREREYEANDRDRSARSRRRPEEEDEDYNTEFDGGSTGYSSNSKFNKQKKDDFKRSGEIGDNDEFDDFGGYGGGGRGNSRRSGGGGGRGSSYSNRRDDDDDRSYSRDEYRGDSSGNRGRGQNSNRRSPPYDNDDRDYRGDSSNDRAFRDSYGYDEDEEDSRRGSSRDRSRDRDRDTRRDSNSRSRSPRRRDDEDDFEFNYDDFKNPLENEPEHRSGNNRKFISSTI